MESHSIIFQVTLLLHLLSNSVSQYMPQMQFPSSAMQMPMGQPMQMGQAMSMPHQMQMPFGMQMAHQKLPMVVMPFNSKSANKNVHKQKRKRNRHRKRHRPQYESGSSSESCSGGDGSTSNSREHDYRRRNSNTKSGTKNHQNHENRRRQVLTPVISYVTKDGYVVYQKKIKQERARDWLELGKKKMVPRPPQEQSQERGMMGSEETMIREIKQKLRARKNANGY